MASKDRKDGYWSFERVKELAEECKTINEFRKKSMYAYGLSVRKGWISEFTWLSKERPHPKGVEVCQYTLDGKFIEKYDSLPKAAEAVKTDKRLIHACCRGKSTHTGDYRWIYYKDMERAADIFKNNPIPTTHAKYTEEEIIEEAKKYRYLKDFRINSSNFYQAALLRNMVDRLNLERSLDPYKDNIYSVYAYFFQETHSVYVGITDRRELREREHKGIGYYACKDKQSAVLKHAKENGLEVPDPVYLKENIGAFEALILEDEYKLYYKEQGWNVLNKAKTGLKSGSLGACKSVSTKKIKDTAAKYKTMKEFWENHWTMYNIAQQRGILGELGLEYVKTPDGTYSEEVCYSIAKECRTVKEFESKNYTSAQTSRKNGWRKQYWWLINDIQKEVIAVKGFKIRIFKSVKNAGEYVGFKTPAAFEDVRKKGKKLGINFHLLDMNDIDWNIPDFEHRVVI